MFEFIWTVISTPFSIIWASLNIICSIIGGTWYLITHPFLVYFVLPVIVIFLIIRHIIGDANLKLQFYEKYGKTPEVLRGQVVWITGASSGIGEQLAYRLIRHGCKLILSSRRGEELERVKKECLAMPANAKEEDIMVLPFDVKDTEKHDGLVNKVLEKFTKIDILVNNAATSQLARISETPLETDREIVELVAIAQISLTKAVLPHWIQRKKGHLVVTSSTSGKFSLPLTATYCLGKQGLHGYFEAFRFEHAKDNIDVTMVCPGPVQTSIGHNLYMEKNMSIDSIIGPSEKNHQIMTSFRCAELMAIAIANKIGEAWITKQPILFMAYLAIYLPDVYRWIGCKYWLKVIKSSVNLPEREETS